MFDMQLTNSRASTVHSGSSVRASATPTAADMRLTGGDTGDESPSTSNTLWRSTDGVSWWPQLIPPTQIPSPLTSGLSISVFQDVVSYMVGAADETMRCVCIGVASTGLSSQMQRTHC